MTSGCFFFATLLEIFDTVAGGHQCKIPKDHPLPRGHENSPFLEKMMASKKKIYYHNMLDIHILDDCMVKKSSSCIGGDGLSVFLHSPTLNLRDSPPQLNSVYYSSRRVTTIDPLTRTQYCQIAYTTTKIGITSQLYSQRNRWLVQMYLSIAHSVLKLVLASHRQSGQWK